jgi:hypothetical protein
MTDDPRDRAEQRTVLLPRPEPVSALAPGTRLQEFVLERALGVGSHSVVYLALDTRLDRRVALKEYLPSMLATRAPGGEVLPRLPRFEAFYAKGLQGFMNEARLLGAFAHPTLIKVYRYWAENGTAYMAMPYYEGITLGKWLARRGAPPGEAWVRQLAAPLMDALDTLHRSGCYHRDVAPDNILLLAEGPADGLAAEAPPRPLLLDFGAARRVIGDATQDLTAVLKSGYSPVEQYDGSEASMRQGPWTDVYALCAVLYTAVVGQAPGSSVARLLRDHLVPARQAARGRYSDVFLAAIDAGLAVRPEHRPRSMAALNALFDAPAALPAPAPPPAPARSPTPARPPWLLPALAGAAVLAAAVALLSRR